MYCSAFPDTDIPFGSVGSFQEFFPSEGSFEANPPFEPTIIASMFEHMVQLLNNAQRLQKCLQFVIIIPCWQDNVECTHDSTLAGIGHCKRCTWNQIYTSTYMTKSMVLASGEHSYTEVRDDKLDSL